MRTQILVSVEGRASEAPRETCTTMYIVRRLRRIRAENIFRATSNAQAFHVPSTVFAQQLRAIAACVAILAVLAFGQHPRAAQVSSSDASSSLFRVFLKDGHALPAYGEPAFVGDRVIFSLVIRPGAGDAVPPAMQLMTLPVSNVDVARTTRYSRSVRAAFFAATSGEAEYQAITSEISSTLDALPAIPDDALRLQLAEEARDRLRAWSRDHYDYRSDDVRELLLAFDRVITRMHGSTGDARMSLDLFAGAADVAPEPVRPQPTLQESIEAALFAARAADDAPTREAVLGTVIGTLSTTGDEPTLLAEARSTLEDERATDRAYAALADDLLSRVDVARSHGDVKAAEGVARDLVRRDAELGSRRPGAVAALADTIAARVAVTRAFRVAYDRYVAEKPTLLAYERHVRPTMSGLDGMAPELQRLRDNRPSTWTSFDATARLLTRLQAFDQTLSTIAPPDDLMTVHAAIESAVRLAREACLRHRQSLVVPSTTVDATSSAAAAGALALLAQARQDLVTHLFPPKPA